MPRVDRTRRKLLAGALAQNVAEIRGELPKGLRPPRRLWLRRLALPALALAALTTWAGAHYLRPVDGTADRAAGQPAAPPVATMREPGPLSPLAAATQALSVAAVATAAEAGPDGAPRIDPAALPLGVRRVVIDPGHGGRDLGTLAGARLTEKEITLDLALRMRELLGADGFEVRLTREDDRKVSLEERSRLANEARADAFVSIHVNSLPERELRGVETYYLGPTEDPRLTQLAADENRDSGYALADFRRLLDSIYVDARREESRQLATATQAALFRSLADNDPQLLDWGVKSAPFVVLIATEAPAILVEVGCLSNREEARLLAQSDYRQRIAAALADGLRAFVAVHPPLGPRSDTPPAPESPTVTAQELTPTASGAEPATAPSSPPATPAVGSSR